MNNHAEAQIKVGRPAMMIDEKRKPRSIKMSDNEWAKMQELAEAQKISIAELIRRSVLGDD
jgi:predicted DNA-binding ribbon-helix-helix protein